MTRDKRVISPALRPALSQDGRDSTEHTETGWRVAWVGNYSSQGLNDNNHLMQVCEIATHVGCDKRCMIISVFLYPSIQITCKTQTENRRKHRRYEYYASFK